MEFSHYDDNQNLSLTKFESMLKTNHVLFFDANEFDNIIHHYLENGKMSLAKKAIKLGLAQHPSSVSLKLFLIEVLVFDNKLEKAETLLEELQAIEPLNEEVYIQKANILSKRDEHAKAIDLFKQILTFTNEASEIHAFIGMEYLFLDDFENAKTYFMKCIEADKEDYSALYNIIYCFDFLEQHQEAIDYLTVYLDSNPYCEVAWHQLGKQYIHLKEYEKALASYDFAIISDDRFIGAYLEKGKVLEKLNRYEEAIENYKITLALDDPTSFALLRIGSCYEKLGNKDLAIKHYYKTIDEDPLLDKGWIAITKYYMRDKDFEKAKFYINKGLNIDAENVNYWKLYALVHHKLNLLEEAENGYKKALELGNYELDTWLARADILIQLGDYRIAIQSLLQAGEFYEDHPEIEYRLTGLYFTINDYDEGYIHLNNALHLDPEYYIIIEELFPKIYNRPSIRQIITNFKKSA